MIRLILIPILLFFSCNVNQTPSKIHIKKVNFKFGDSITNTDSFYTMNDKYFEIKLALSGSQYIALKDLKPIKEGHSMSEETILIVDSKKDALKFNSSTEFLNFIDEAGYKLVSQIPNQYGADYTFEKK